MNSKGANRITKKVVVLVLLLLLINLQLGIQKGQSKFNFSGSHSEFTGILHANLNAFSAVAAPEVYQVISYPSFVVGSENNLYLIYKEVSKNTSKIAFLESDTSNWNLSRTYLVESKEDLAIADDLSITAISKDLYVAYVVREEEANYRLKVLKRDNDSKTWSEFFAITNSTSLFSYLRFERSFDNNLWLTWIANYQENSDLCYIKFNSSSLQWTNITKISTSSENDIQDVDLFVDSSGNGHFVWSEGEEHHKRVHYREIHENGTMQPIIILTDGETNCIEPTVFVEPDGSINVFWSNLTVPYPGESLGTKYIHTTIKSPNDDWSEPLEVAPYLPLERPGGFSDAFTPAVTMDKQNRLWLAHAIRETYVYRSGIDIRSRISGQWQPSEKLSLGTNPAITPQIECDNNGNIHCIWLDFRTGYYKIYFRIKYSTDFWSDEVCLTEYARRPGESFRFIGLAIGLIVLLIAPLVLISEIRRNRRKRLMEKKMNELKIME